MWKKYLSHFSSCIAAAFLTLAPCAMSGASAQSVHEAQPAGQSRTDSSEIDVSARANSWTGGEGRETGLALKPGDRLSVTVDPSQKWRAGNDQPCTRTSNADGLSECYGHFSSHGLDANYGSLVGRIGNGRPFLIGTSFDRIVEEAGELRLYYWDENVLGNSGSVAAEVRVSRHVEDTLDLSGNWEGQYDWQNTGPITGVRACLRQSGNSVSGVYTWSGGANRGTIDEGTLGQDRLELAFSNSDCVGTGYYVIAPDGAKMAGKYYCPGGTGEWELARSRTDAPGLCEQLAAEADPPDIVSIEILDAETTGEGNKKIAIGQSFRVRLTYEEAAGADFTETVTVKTSGGVTELVKVKVEANAKVAESAPILVRPISP